MKKIYLLVMGAVLISSCQKSDAYLKEESLKANYLKGVHLEQKPEADIKECSILQIIYPVGTGNDILQFSYNSSGDPTSVTRQLGGNTGRPNLVFKYDAKNRLTDFIGPYSNNITAEFWHKYFYDSQGRIILDSAYIFPRISNGFPENAFVQQLTYYTYDSKKRIIKDSTVFSNAASPVVHTYAYDEKGNRTGSIYDDQINMNRTNRVWMFLNRDYSVNNPFRAGTYNATGLPTNFNLASEERTFGFLGTAFSSAEIVYGCQGK